MFNFTDESKKKYFAKARSILEAAGLSCFEIDERKITVARDSLVKVYLMPFNKRTVSREQLSMAKKLPEFKVINDRYQKVKKGTMPPIAEHAYIEIEISERI